MPTFNSTIYNAQKPDRLNPSRLAEPNVASGEVEYAIIKYTLAGTEVQGDIINLCILPAGVVPIPQLSKVTANTDPSANTLLLDIGTADNADGWADGINLAAGGQVECTSGTFPEWMNQTPLVADAQSGNAVVYATLATASGVPDAGDILYFTLAYKRGK